MSERIPLADDPNVKIPAAVRASAARATEIFNAQQNSEGVSYQEHREANGLPAAGQTTVTPQGNAAGETPAGETPAPAQQTPAPVQQNTQAAQPDGDGDTWEHKFKSEHGRYLRSQDQIKTLSDELRNLQQVVAGMSAAAPRGEQTFQAEKLLTDEEVTDYGEDFLDVVGRKAKQELAPLMNEINRLKATVDGVTNGQRMGRMEQMYATLAQELPNWGEINTNPAFGAWLALPDPYSGAIRKDMLSAAHAQGNANRVLAFFKGFLTDEAVTNPASAEPEKGTIVPKVPLSTFAAPGRAKTVAQNPTGQEKPSISRAQIASFYAEVAAGKYRQNPEEKVRLEEMIFSAQAEGRIR